MDFGRLQALEPCVLLTAILEVSMGKAHVEVVSLGISPDCQHNQNKQHGYLGSYLSCNVAHLPCSHVLGSKQIDPA